MRWLDVNVVHVTPDASDPDGEQLPFGIHPLIDMMKLVSMIANQQYALHVAIGRLHRALFLCSLLWVAVGALEVLRWVVLAARP